MTNESENERQEQSEVTTSRPAAKFSGSGGLQAAVWRHRSDDGREYFTTKLERSYMDGDGNFQSTNYLRDGDLLRAARILEQADAYVEQEKAKSRGVARNNEDRSR